MGERERWVHIRQKKFLNELSTEQITYRKTFKISPWNLTIKYPWISLLHVEFVKYSWVDIVIKIKHRKVISLRSGAKRSQADKVVRRDRENMFIIKDEHQQQQQQHLPTDYSWPGCNERCVLLASSVCSLLTQTDMKWNLLSFLSTVVHRLWWRVQLHLLPCWCWWSSSSSDSTSPK